MTDFGIARAGVSEITQAGSVMGTPHYLSPEQAQGFDVTAVSDLYSIGVMLYEALTRRVPFEADSAVAVAMKQVSAGAAAPELDQPAGLTGARRDGDAGPGEGAGPALPERRCFHRRPRRGAQGPRWGGGQHRRLRAAAPGRRHAGGAGRRGDDRGGGAAPAPAPHLDAGRGRGPDRPAGRLCADPRHQTRKCPT